MKQHTKYAKFGFNAAAPPHPPHPREILFCEPPPLPRNLTNEHMHINILWWGLLATGSGGVAIDGRVQTPGLADVVRESTKPARPPWAASDFEYFNVSPNIHQFCLHAYICVCLYVYVYMGYTDRYQTGEREVWARSFRVTLCDAPPTANVSFPARVVTAGQSAFCTVEAVWRELHWKAVFFPEC